MFYSIHYSINLSGMSIPTFNSPEFLPHQLIFLVAPYQKWRLAFLGAKMYKFI